MKRLVTMLLLASAMAWAAPAPAGNPDVPEKFVSVDEAKSLVDKRRRITFIDVREKAQYDDLHIKGAINIPLGVLPARLAEISRTDFIVLY
ncbi:MAG: rhodanese-like domain-containing protein [Candidatus Rokubacteria bacterium]|nr:rhodanese-like domain-containing protein [Candidatus Rokubacteria bacterium]